MARKKRKKQHTNTTDATDYGQLSNDALFASLNPNQRRFVVATLENPQMSKKEIGELIGIQPDTIYRWTKAVDEAIARARTNAYESAIAIRKSALMKAMAVKLALLDSDDEKLRSSVASEIIEWSLGKAQQHQTLTANVTNTWHEILNVDDADVDDIDDDFA